MLLKYGASVASADDEGNTPLHFAAMRGTREVATFLFDLKANPYATNNQGQVPFEVAVRTDIKQFF